MVKVQVTGNENFENVISYFANVFIHQKWIDSCQTRITVINGPFCTYCWLHLFIVWTKDVILAQYLRCSVNSHYLADYISMCAASFI